MSAADAGAPVSRVALSVSRAAPTSRADTVQQVRAAATKGGQARPGLPRPMEANVRPEVRHRAHTNGRITSAAAAERTARPRTSSGAVSSAWAVAPSVVKTMSSKPTRVEVATTRRRSGWGMRGFLQNSVHCSIKVEQCTEF